MPAGKFDPELEVDAEGRILAGGPLDMPKDEVVEMCVWVYQRDGHNDAIANQMRPGPEAALREASDGDSAGMGDMGGMGRETGSAPKSVTIVRDSDGNNRRWELLLDDLMGKKGKFTDGSATALAIGVFRDQNEHETVFVWSEAVQLKVAAPPGS
jgi:hypothetical protein